MNNPTKRGKQYEDIIYKGGQYLDIYYVEICSNFLE